MNSTSKYIRVKVLRVWYLMRASYSHTLTPLYRRHTKRISFPQLHISAINERAPNTENLFTFWEITFWARNSTSSLTFCIGWKWCDRKAYCGVIFTIRWFPLCQWRELLWKWTKKKKQIKYVRNSEELFTQWIWKLVSTQHIWMPNLQMELSDECEFIWKRMIRV